MYKCYTSYMSNKRIRRREAFKIPVSSRVYCWDGYSDWYRDLAPEDRMVRWINDQPKITKSVKETFTKHYLAKLNSLKEEGTLDKYVEDIELRLKYEDVFLLCYETPKKFCHRHILAQYLNEHFSMDIQEF